MVCSWYLDIVPTEPQIGTWLPIDAVDNKRSDGDTIRWEISIERAGCAAVDGCRKTKGWNRSKGTVRVAYGSGGGTPHEIHSFCAGSVAPLLASVGKGKAIKKLSCAVVEAKSDVHIAVISGQCIGTDVAECAFGAGRGTKTIERASVSGSAGITK